MKSTPVSSLALDYTPAETASADRSKMRRVVVASSLGNALEMYDFTVYSFFAVIIGQLFFPADSPWPR